MAVISCLALYNLMKLFALHHLRENIDKKTNFKMVLNNGKIHIIEKKKLQLTRLFS